MVCDGAVLSDSSNESSVDPAVSVTAILQAMAAVPSTVAAQPIFHLASTLVQIRQAYLGRDWSSFAAATSDAAEVGMMDGVDELLIPLLPTTVFPYGVGHVIQKLVRFIPLLAPSSTHGVLLSVPLAFHVSQRDCRSLRRRSFEVATWL